MIDIHCHILPGVDDGPKTFESSKKMLDMAYSDGIRQIIATPHINHPFVFQSNLSIQETYQKLKQYAEETYPDFGLFLGSEVFVTSDYHRDIERLKKVDFLNQSLYLLVEFSREAQASLIKEVAYELKLKGYVPIIAHVEMYPCLLKNAEHVEALSHEGALIQVTGASVLGKHGHEIERFTKRLIRKGLVDFVATDAHSDTYRRPTMKKVYDWVASEVSASEAKRLFVDNAQAVIHHLKTQPSTVKITPQKKSFSKGHYLATAGALLLAMIFLTSFMYGRETPVYGYDQEPEVIQVAKETKETPEGLPEESPVESVEVPQAVHMAEEPLDTDEEEAAYDEIVALYYDALSSLQNQYIEQIEEVVACIQIARSSIKDEETKGDLIESYLQDLMLMEELSDIKVYDLLYDMQNALEAHRFDVGEVGVFREAYHDIKAEHKTYYLERIRD